MEWILQNLLLCVGIVGFAIFLLAGLTAVAVLRKKHRRIEQAVLDEYEQVREYSAV